MSVFWGRNDKTWRPYPACEDRDWKDLAAGDLIGRDRRVWRIIEIRKVPVIDWDEADRGHYEGLRAAFRPPRSEEEWDYRPLYLTLVPAEGGKRRHVKARPYVWGRMTVVSEHYPVCRDCGEPWPCRELDISLEVRRESAEMDRLSKIGPGCCWGCGEPVTHRQNAIRFDGENLLLPGAPPTVFHMRRKGDCLSAAHSYEKRWVGAEPGRRWRLQCPGFLTLHLDGDECSEGAACPGRVTHRAGFAHHVYLVDGERRHVAEYSGGCTRCSDAEARGQTEQALGEPPPGAML